MMVESLNMLFFFFFLIIFSVIINANTSLHLLLTAELFWISLYVFFFFVGFAYNNVNVLALTFFSLVFSAVELGIGLVLLLTQNTLTRSLSLSENDKNFLKFTNRFKSKLYLNKVKW